MPEMNGIELCRVIRNDITLNHLPIVMLTAKTQAEYHLEGYDAGADAYITKPVEMVLLTAQIKALIANRKLLVQSNIISYYPTELDSVHFRHHIVSYDKIDILIFFQQFKSFFSINSCTHFK